MAEQPEGSEIPIEEWLRQIGAENIRYCGGDSSNGPPDFLIEYGDEEIAVEGTLLHDTKGWIRKREAVIDRVAQRLYEEAYKEGFAWHGFIEYDSQESENAIEDRSWQERMRKALRSEYGGAFQLLSPEKQKGRGVVLRLCLADNEGGINPIRTDAGSWTASALLKGLVYQIPKKAEKVDNSENAKRYKLWWLVFDDEILIAPKDVLSEHEIQHVQKQVQICPGAKRWSKIVLMSRFQTVPPPAKPPKWFWSLQEDPNHKFLPDSPHRSAASRSACSDTVAANRQSGAGE